jgi:hypothetical protein
MAFQISYVYDYITKSCRQQAEVIQNHANENVRYIGQGEARHRKYKRLLTVCLIYTYCKQNGVSTKKKLCTVRYLDTNAYRAPLCKTVFIVKKATIQVARVLQSGLS